MSIDIASFNNANQVAFSQNQKNYLATQKNMDSSFSKMYEEFLSKNLYTSPNSPINYGTSNLPTSQNHMDAIFQRASEQYNLPVSLIKAVAKAESNFNPDAVSSAGAIGVMQLMPATAKSLGVSNPYDAEQNIMGGTKYLRQMLDTFDGDIELALAAYNAGPGNVKKYGGIPPFSQTQKYVPKVLGYAEEDTSMPSMYNSAITSTIIAASQEENSSISQETLNAVYTLQSIQYSALSRQSTIANVSQYGNEENTNYG